MPTETHQLLAPALEADRQRFRSYRRNLKRYLHRLEKRRAFFSSAQQQKGKETKRIFILSPDERPWLVFGHTRWVQHHKFVFETSGDANWSALHQACAQGDRKRVRALLLDKRARVCTLARSSCGRIALHDAVVCERFSIIRLLLRRSDASVQVQARDNAQLTAMHYALTKLQALARTQKKPLPGPMDMANPSDVIKRRYQKLWNVADQLLTLAALSIDPHNLSCELDLLYRGDLWDVCRRGDSDRFQLLCKLFFPGPAGRSRLQELQLDHLKRTLLHEAVSDRSHATPAIVYRLVSIYGMPRHIQDASGCTALHYAAMSGSKELCVLLLDDDGEDFDPEPLLLCQDARGRTALHWSLLARSTDRADRLQTAAYLAQQCVASLFAVDSDGFTPLHLAIERGEIELIQQFIALGASVNSSPTVYLRTNKDRENDQTRAIWAPCAQVFQRKSKKRLGTEAHDDEQQSGFGCRQFGGVCQECVMDSDPPDRHSKPANTVQWLSPLAMAVSCAVQLIRDDHSAPSSASLLSRSARAIDIVDSLLLAGADPNADSDEESDAELSPLSRAVGYGYERLISSLLAHGARYVSSKAVVLLCASETIDSAVKASILQSLIYAFNILSKDLITRLLPILFHRSCFAMLTRLSSDSSPEGEAVGCVRVWSELRQNAQQKSEARGNSRENWSLTLGHLEFLVSQIKMDDKAIKIEDKTDMTMLLQHSLSLCLRQWEITLRRSAQCNPTQHDARERVVLGCMKFFQSTEHHGCDQSVIAEWLELTIRQGLFQCALALLQTHFSHSLCLEAVLKNYAVARWRELRFHSQFLAVCMEKTQELLENQTDGVPQVLVTAPALVHACAFDIPGHCVNWLLLLYQKQSQQELGVLLKLRVNGKTMIEWIIANNRMDTATYLWQISTQDSSSIIPLIWRQFVAAGVAHAPHTDQWLEWLLAQHEYKFPESDWSWMLHRALRCDSTVAFRYLMDQHQRWFQSHVKEEESGETNVQDQVNELLCTWFSNSFFVHELAQWNAVNVTKYSLEHLSSPQFRALWSSQSQQIHPENNCTPIKLARMLDHEQVAQLLLSSDLNIQSNADMESIITDNDQDTAVWPETGAHFGLFRSILMANDKPEEPQPLITRWNCKTDHLSSLNGNWTAACALNQVGHLRAFTLHGHSNPMQDESVFVDLLLKSIAHGAEKAFAWLLDPENTRILAMVSPLISQRVLEAASKHPSDVYARMTLLLLNCGRFHPGRLAGDGTEITLLHRAACFSNADLAKQILTELLAIEGCDINVLDAFGNTPLAYACYTGQLANACFLMTQPATRLEAEYEGQSCFYYTLHLMPSFSWRWIAQKLLITKRKHAFLHCQASYEDGGGGCACKGFEQRETATTELEEASETDDTRLLCGFCGHSADHHLDIPYPSWFADQYDSYRGVVSPEEEEDKDSDRGSESMENVGQIEPTEKPETVENTLGRLNLDTLRRVTSLHYSALLDTYKLQLTPESQETHGQDAETIEKSIAELNSESTSAWPMIPLNVLYLNEPDEMIATSNSDGNDNDSAQDSGELGADLYACSPWFMRSDLVKLHPVNCNCHQAILITTDDMWKYSILSKWLRHAALNTPALDLQAALKHWRSQSMTNKDNSKELSDTSASVPPLQPSIGRRCLVQWRYGREMTAFRCWKRWRTTGQIVHHHVEEKADDMTTQMRHIRLQSLRQRQMELQRTISALNIKSTKI